MFLNIERTFKHKLTRFLPAKRWVYMIEAFPGLVIGNFVLIALIHGETKIKDFKIKTLWIFEEN